MGRLFTTKRLKLTEQTVHRSAPGRPWEKAFPTDSVPTDWAKVKWSGGARSSCPVKRDELSNFDGRK